MERQAKLFGFNLEKVRCGEERICHADVGWLASEVLELPPESSSLKSFATDLWSWKNKGGGCEDSRCLCYLAFV